MSDDVRDVAFDREVLLHFLIGLTPFIRDIVLPTECSYSSIDSFIQEAKKHSNAIKEEPIEPEIKLKIDEKAKESKELNEFVQTSLLEYKQFILINIPTNVINVRNLSKHGEG